MSKVWVDFQRIRQRAGIEAVLSRYGVDWLRLKGDELVGRCPVHESTDVQSTAFQANIHRGIWKCFSCGRGGNVIDLVAALEACSPHQAAVELVEWFGLSDAVRKTSGRSQRRAKTSRAPDDHTAADLAVENIVESAATPAAASIDRVSSKERRGGGGNCMTRAATPAAQESEVANPPLSFELRALVSSHPYLAERRIRAGTVEHFGLGYCGRGMLRGRIAIPIHDSGGVLVGYAGRLVPAELELARTAEPEGSDPPPYRFPSREKGFRKSYLLFNIHRARERAGDLGLVVVEGFFDCLRFYQAGVTNVVALMGCHLAEEQERLLLATTDRITLALDRDEAGRQGTQELLGRLVTKCYVRVLEYPATQPDDCPEEQLRELFRERQL